MAAAAACSTAILLGAYYYGWYGIGEQWDVFPRAFEPSMGDYNSSDKFVMDAHHRQGKAACIQFFATSWAGDGSRSPMGVDPNQEVAGACELTDKSGNETSPRCTRDGKQVDLQSGQTYRIGGWDGLMQWWAPFNEIDEALKRNLNVQDGVPMVLMYEIRELLGVGEHSHKVDLSAGDNPTILKHHLLYAADHHFMHPNYFRINGSPVLFLYTLRDFINFAAPLSEAFRAVEERIGAPLFIIGDVIWWQPNPPEFPWQDYHTINVSAITAYNLYDSAQRDKMDGAFPWHSAGVYASFTAHAPPGIQVVPYVSPGYDDSKMRGLERPVIPRFSGVSYLKSWYFASAVASLQRKANYPSLVMVNSFNEWHEGTQIEASVAHGEAYSHLTRDLRNAFATWTPAHEEEEGAGEGWAGRGKYGAELPSHAQELQLLAKHHPQWKEGADPEQLTDEEGRRLSQDLQTVRDQIFEVAEEESFTCGGRGAEAEALQAKLLQFPWPNYKRELQALCGYGGYEIIVQSYYMCMLGRKADRPGLISYAKQLQAGDLTLEKLQDELLQSEEATQFLQAKARRFFEGRVFPEADNREELFVNLCRIYLKALRRIPDAVTVLRYVTWLVNGDKNWHDLQHSTKVSDERQEVIRQEQRILFPDGEQANADGEQANADGEQANADGEQANAEP